MQDTIIGGCDRMRYQDLFFEKGSLFLVTGGGRLHRIQPL